MDISDLFGLSGETQLERIQESLDGELEELMCELREKLKKLSGNYFGYDLTEYAEEYIKDNL